MSKSNARPVTSYCVCMETNFSTNFDSDGTHTYMRSCTLLHLSPPASSVGSSTLSPTHSLSPLSFPVISVSPCYPPVTFLSCLPFPFSPCVHLSLLSPCLHLSSPSPHVTSASHVSSCHLCLSPSFTVFPVSSVTHSPLYLTNSQYYLLCVLCCPISPCVFPVSLCHISVHSVSPCLLCPHCLLCVSSLPCLLCLHVNSLFLSSFCVSTVCPVYPMTLESLQCTPVSLFVYK